MSLVRQQYTKPLPKHAELYMQGDVQYARWKGRGGKRKTARVTTGRNGEPRLLLTSNKYSAQYRNGAGQVQRVSTGCRSKEAAERVLNELNVRADKVRSGAWTAAEDAVLDHQSTPINEHVEAYLNALKNKRGKGAKVRVAPKHVANVRRYLTQIVAECGWKTLRELNRTAMEKWADRQETRGTALRTLNDYLMALCAFGNWCVETSRLVANPFSRPPKRDANADRRRERRALTEDELRLLLRITRMRPIAEKGREKASVANKPRDPKSRKTWRRATLTLDTIESAYQRGLIALKNRPDEIDRRERLGAERALIYKTLVLTGLRKNELASLTVGNLETDWAVPFLRVEAENEKAGRGAEVVVRTDLFEDLQEQLNRRLRTAQDEARRNGRPVPARLPMDEPLLSVPTGLLAIMDRDLVAAGLAREVVDSSGKKWIDKRDERGRTIDVHALRHTFGTHLSKGGVAPRTAQAAMRHSSIDLTMNTYTDPKLLDMEGALEALPPLPLDGERGRESARATGTDGAAANAGTRAARQRDGTGDEPRFPRGNATTRPVPANGGSGRVEHSGADSLPSAPPVASTTTNTTNARDTRDACDDDQVADAPDGHPNGQALTRILTLTLGNLGGMGSCAGNERENQFESDARVSAVQVSTKHRESFGGEKRVMGFEPTTFTLAT